MTKHTPTMLAAMLVSAMTSAHAGSLAEWKFDDAAGTSLVSSSNSGSAGGSWSLNFDATTTDGTGKLVSKKPSGGNWNTYWPVPDGAPAKLWMVVDLAGWNLAGSKIKEAVRAGFSASDDDNKPQVVAQAVLARVPSGFVSLRGDALGDGATSIEGEVPPMQTTRPEALSFIVGLDREAGTYSLAMRTAEAGLRQIGTGKISPGREAKYVRFSIAGDLSDPEEAITIDRIAVTDTDPATP